MIPLPHPGPSIGHVPNAQRHDPGSLLQFVQKLIRRYRASAEIGWGELSILKQPHAGVLAHRVTDRPAREHDRPAQFHGGDDDGSAHLDGANGDTRLVDLLDEEVSMTGANGSVKLDLDAYGYRWLRVLDPGSKRLS